MRILTCLLGLSCIYGFAGFTVKTKLDFERSTAFRALKLEVEEVPEHNKSYYEAHWHNWERTLVPRKADEPPAYDVWQRSDKVSGGLAMKSVSMRILDQWAGAANGDSKAKFNAFETLMGIVSPPAVNEEIKAAFFEIEKSDKDFERKFSLKDGLSLSISKRGIGFLPAVWIWINVK